MTGKDHRSTGTVCADHTGNYRGNFVTDTVNLTVYTCLLELFAQPVSDGMHSVGLTAAAFHVHQVTPVVDNILSVLCNEFLNLLFHLDPPHFVCVLESALAVYHKFSPKNLDKMLLKLLEKLLKLLRFD